MTRLTTLLLDRDGTVIKDKHYLADPDGVELFPGAGEALGRLFRQNLRLFVVSNQSGVGRGYFSEQDVLACNARLAELLAPHGAELDDSVFCPHAPEDVCSCRKPALGMWEELRKKYGLDPAAALLVGDKPEDMAFAEAAGLACRILVLTGKGRATAEGLGLLPAVRAAEAKGETVIFVTEAAAFPERPGAAQAGNPSNAGEKRAGALPQYIIAGLADLPKAVEAWEKTV